MRTEHQFWRGKKVLITGHTGFKGTWLCHVLLSLGADVAGYSLPPPAATSLYGLSARVRDVKSRFGDINDFNLLLDMFRDVEPEIVIHMAAQPLVRAGYADPQYTFGTNVMGTVNLLEAMRSVPCSRSFLNVTTDKVYRNNEWVWGYRETDALGGADPYSCSKSCAELVTDSYRQSFFADQSVAVSTARAGNVIGGGDFAADRIIPDCVRAATDGQAVVIRNPESVRPYQHVLEPLNAYMAIVRRQYDDPGFGGCYNVGPDEDDCVGTEALVRLFCRYWGGEARYERKGGPGDGREARLLKLDCSKLKSAFIWKPRWNIETAVEKTVEWHKNHLSGVPASELLERQIEEFMT